MHYHRGVLCHPFLPFTVVFSQAITTLDLDDLNTLSEIVAIMERAKKACSKISRLHHVCSVLHRVAKVYIEDRLTKATDGHRVRNVINHEHLVLDTLYGNSFGVSGAGGVEFSNAGEMGNINGNNSIFATPSELSSMNAATNTNGSRRPIATDIATAASTTGNDSASFGLVNPGSRASVPTAVQASSLGYVGGVGNRNFGPDFQAGVSASASASANANANADANTGIGSGRFLDDSSLSMMEMGGPPSFSWLPTGQDMVGLLDTDMGMFDI